MSLGMLGNIVSQRWEAYLTGTVRVRYLGPRYRRTKCGQDVRTFVCILGFWELTERRSGFRVPMGRCVQDGGR